MIKIKFAAHTDVGLVRTNNEDNFQISRDLTVEPMKWVNNEMCILGEYGCLLVVADGMGGAEAGEVASRIAIDTIKSEFSPVKIKEIKIDNSSAINAHISNVLILADQRIKDYAKSNPETKGMGTTIVLAWIVNNKLYIGWCGDSRAYIFNPTYGLVRLTKDHSYVQQLVDAGKLSEEEAFDFPDSNIITNCLSTSSQKAKPEILNAPITISNNDIILLCTDGLSGMLKDKSISTIIKVSQDNMSDLVNRLVTSALKASGSDNVTVALCKICSGAQTTSISILERRFNYKSKKKIFSLIAIIFSVFVILTIWLVSMETFTKPHGEQEIITNLIDSDSISNIDDTEQELSDNIGSNFSKSDDISSETLNKLEKTRFLDKIKANGLPATSFETKSDKDTLNEDAIANEDIDRTPETIIVTVTNDVTLGKFMEGLKNNMNDFKTLNPEINPDSIKPGMKIKVYKK